jgi:hypothetical protein
MSFGGKTPSWQKRQEERAQFEREFRAAKNRRALGIEKELSPLLPTPVLPSGSQVFAIGVNTANTVEITNWQHSYASMISSATTSINDFSNFMRPSYVLDESAPVTSAFVAERKTERPVRELTPMQAWRD